MTRWLTVFLFLFLGSCAVSSHVEPIRPGDQSTIKRLPVPRQHNVSHDFSRIDRHAINTPAEAERSFDSLAAWLGRPARTDREKARVIYRWLAQNIAYDVEALRRGDIRNSDVQPMAVLRRRKSVCDGYARLFLELGQRMGLEVERVVGYGKGAGSEAGQPIPPGSNHAWNAVKIDGKWELVDATWGAGHTNGDKFIRKFNEAYFLPPPENFIYDHFPDYDRWQLIENPVSRADFSRMAHISPAFLDNGLGLESHLGNTITVKDRVEITFRVPENIAVSINLSKNGRKISDSYYSQRREGKTVTVSVFFPESGDYRFRLFAGKAGFRKEKQKDGKEILVGYTLTNAIDYKILASAGTREHPPKFHENFYKHGMKLLSHHQNNIEVQEEVTISIQAPQNIVMLGLMRMENTFKTLDRSMVFQQRDGDRILITARPPKKGTLILTLSSAEKSEKQKMYNPALSYTLQVKKPAREPAAFPEVYSTDREGFLLITSPLRRYHPVGSTVHFKIRTNRFETLSIGEGLNRMELKREGEWFTGKYKIVKGRNTLYGGSQDSGRRLIGVLRLDGK